MNQNYNFQQNMGMQSQGNVGPGGMMAPQQGNMGQMMGPRGQ